MVRNMNLKKCITTAVMFVGVVLLGVEMIAKPVDGTYGYALTTISILMILGSFISLCLLNRCRKEETAETVELGLNLIEMILDFFLG